MKSSSLIKVYTLSGLVIGLLFPVVATYVHTNLQGHPFSLEHFLIAQQNTPLLWFMDLVPLVVAFIAFIAGKNHAKLLSEKITSEQVIDEKTEHLRKKNRELKKENEERKITEKQLLIAKDDSERAKRAEELFLANMSHELRTPLNAVIGFNRLLLSTQLNNVQNEYVNTIQTSANHLMAVINDILEISKIKAGEIEFDEISISLTKTVINAVNTFKMAATQKNVALFEEIDHRIPPYLLADQTRLNQILLNLLGNALKFTNEGSIVLKVDLLKNDNDKCRLRFSVIDTGIGIAPEKLDKIFEKFKQAEADTTRNFGGTGLGLSICKEMVELQGGKIDVVSEVGKGSTFSFELSFKHAPSQETADPVKGAIEQKDIGVLKMLLVEDNKINVKLAENVFKRWGGELEYDVAKNGQEAIDLLKDNDYQIILMDLQMPVMDGFEATRYIRNKMDAPKKDLPIIALTADVMLSEKTKAFEAGISDYITKPFDANKLFSSITQLLQ